MGIQGSSFYNWKQTLSNPPKRTKALLENLAFCVIRLMDTDGSMPKFGWTPVQSCQISMRTNAVKPWE